MGTDRRRAGHEKTVATGGKSPYKTADGHVPRKNGPSNIFLRASAMGKKAGTATPLCNICLNYSKASRKCLRFGDKLAEDDKPVIYCAGFAAMLGMEPGEAVRNAVTDAVKTKRSTKKGTPPA